MFTIPQLSCSIITLNNRYHPGPSDDHFLRGTDPEQENPSGLAQAEPTLSFPNNMTTFLKRVTFQALPSQTHNIFSWQASIKKISHLSMSPSRTLQRPYYAQPKFLHTRSGVSAKGSPRLGSSSGDVHNTPPALSANGPRVPPGAASKRELPPNYQSTFRRLVIEYQIGFLVIIFQIQREKTDLVM